MYRRREKDEHGHPKKFIVRGPNATGALDDEDELSDEERGADKVPTGCRRQSLVGHLVSARSAPSAPPLRSAEVPTIDDAPASDVALANARRL